MKYTKGNIRQYLHKYFGVDDENIIVADCESNGYDDTLFFPPDTLPNNEEEKGLLPALQFRRLLARTDFCDLSCYAGMRLAVLFPNGEIYPCHHFFGYPEFLIAHFDGNTFDFSNYPNVLQSLSPSRKLKNPSCDGCYLKAVCHICPAAILLSDKYAALGERECDSVREYHRKLFLTLGKQLSREDDVQV